MYSQVASCFVPMLNLGFSFLYLICRSGNVLVRRNQKNHPSGALVPASEPIPRLTQFTDVESLEQRGVWVTLCKDPTIQPRNNWDNARVYFSWICYVIRWPSSLQILLVSLVLCVTSKSFFLFIVLGGFQ